MKARCYYSSRPQFKDWGGRGIRVCATWKKDYVVFKEWALANGYQDGLTLDRTDNNSNYTPENCRWVTRKENSRNTRTNKIIAAFGEEKPLAAWADDMRCRVSYATLVYRVLKGWNPEVAIKQATS